MIAAKGRGGRPRSAPQDVRQHTIGVRVNAAEWDALQRKADAAGLPLGHWLRRVALGRGLPRPPAPAINRQAYTELARLAGNINQLAHAAHMGRDVAASSLLAEVLSAVRALRLELLGAAHDR